MNAAGPSSGVGDASGTMITVVGPTVSVRILRMSIEELGVLRRMLLLALRRLLLHLLLMLHLLLKAILSQLHPELIKDLYQAP